MKQCISVSIIVLSALVYLVNAEYAYFNYVEEPLNTRSMSLGGAGSASCTGGFSFYNPAAAAAERSFVALDFGRQWGELSRGSAETAWNFERWFFVASMHTRALTFQTADITGVLGSATDQESLASCMFGIKREYYALAIAANGLLQNIMDRNAFSASVSGGIVMDVLPGKLKTGMAILQAGRYHRGFYDNNYSAHKDSMSTSFRCGVAWNDTVLGTIPVMVVADAVYSKSSDEVLFPVGVEFRPHQALGLRIGKRFNHATDIITFGLGFSWENITFDAALVPTTFEGDIETKWLMGLRYALPSLSNKKIRKRTVVRADTTTVVPLVDTVGAQPGRKAETVVDTNAPIAQPAVTAAEDSAMSTETPAAPSADSTSTVITNDRPLPPGSPDAADLPVQPAVEKPPEIPHDSLPLPMPENRKRD